MFLRLVAIFLLVFSVSRAENFTGLKEGKITLFYDNGQKKMEGVYHQNAMVGQWTFWYSDGKVCSKFQINLDDKPSDVFVWYPDGNLWFEGKFIHPKDYLKNLSLVGPYSIWSKDKKLLAQGAHSNDFNLFDSSGTVRAYCSRNNDAGGTLSIQVFLNNDECFFDFERQSNGWGGNQTWRESLNLNQKYFPENFGPELENCEITHNESNQKDSPVINQSVLNGSVTLFYPDWLESYESFNPNNFFEFNSHFKPFLKGAFADGKKTGNWTIVRPFTNVTDEVLCQFEFDNDQLNGPFYYANCEVDFKNDMAISAENSKTDLINPFKGLYKIKAIHAESGQ